jgi:hypothetical protein
VLAEQRPDFGAKKIVSLDAQHGRELSTQIRPRRRADGRNATLV